MAEVVRPSSAPPPEQPPDGEADRRTRRTPRRGGRRAHGAVAVLLLPFVVLFLLFYLAPIGYALYQSFFKVQRDGTFGRPETVFGGFEQYVRVFENEAFRESVGRVLLFGIVQVPLMLGLALLFALLLDSGLLPLKRFFRLAYFTPYAVPGVIAAIIWGFLYSPALSPFSWVTERVPFMSGSLVLWSLANITTWMFTGYNMLIIYAALKAVPQELYEAARLDGAGDIRIALSIKVPMVRPALALTGVFSIIGTLQLFTEPQVFRSLTTAVTGSYTPNLVVYSTSVIPNFNLAAAFSVVLALATFALSFIFLRITQRGSSL
ncbi:ABC transporter permease [Micromonospora echinospora]|uniref:Carbohydrate ABC transporter membrane protein 1, CUT1 family n=1 Tax=Micromonospora echinospora TaxID=1877 RepID=A0A1C4YYD0_MICEC|nr:sugar ABC transporter permease [Micromonospora echinospora]OZV77210.1 ABC transporter permease [Micromonospora echinospora]SCF25782.1 carbohydrate ABC transporter membrane protein 1, CUT1 family [Micromonospora echinospora]